MPEESFISNTKSRNADLFAAALIQVKPEVVEHLLRVAYRAGREDARDELRSAANVSLPPGFEGLFGGPRQ